MRNGRSLPSHLSLFLELTKFRVSFFATLSVVAGFVLAKQGISDEILMPALGVFLLASGSCGLNQYQERRTDGLMERTKNRPLPSGRLNPCTAFGISSGLIFLGSLLLLCVNGVVLALGVFAALWYNGVYTYLKSRTAFAVIPGALIGAIPPLLGWVSGGGSLLDPCIGAVAFFFFIWQVPHFWLHLSCFSADYERAGLPSLKKTFSTKQRRGILLIWIFSTAAAGLMIPLFRSVNFHLVSFLLVLLTLWLVWSTILFRRSCSGEASIRSIFMKLNIYVLLVISSLSLDRLL
jgi:heme o synthase